MRVMQIALRLSMAFVVLGFLGVAAGIVTLSFMCPAGCPQLTTPPALIVVAGGVFVAGAVGAFGFGLAVTVRQSGNPTQPQPALTGIDGSTDSTGVGDGGPASEFSPMGLSLRRGLVPTSSSVPWGQHLAIHPDALEVRNVFDRARVPRDQIVGLYRMPGAIRVIWDDGDSTATITDWFRISKIASAMEVAGYRFASD